MFVSLRSKFLSDMLPFALFPHASSDRGDRTSLLSYSRALRPNLDNTLTPYLPTNLPLCSRVYNMVAELRRSGRVSVRPDSVYEDALREAAGKKARRPLALRLQEPVESSPGGQISHEWQERSKERMTIGKNEKANGSSKRKRSSLKRATETDVESSRETLAKKEPITYSTDDETSDEDDLDKIMGEKNRRKHRRDAGMRKGAGGRGLANLREGKCSLLFECLARELPIEKRMKDWVVAYEKEEDERGDDADGMMSSSLVDMFNFLLWSSGATKTYVKRDRETLPMLDSEEWETMINGIVQDMRAGGVLSYPLLEGARFKGFRGRFAEAWELLVKAVREGNAHKLEPVHAVIDLVRALCEVPLVSIRHTAAYAGLRLGNALVQQTLALSKKVEVASRQLEAEQHKGGARSRKALDLNSAINDLTSHQTALEAVLEEIFNGVFASRYRDVSERVRADCMDGLGFFLDTYPSMFLRDQFVKYLGWMLYDKASTVRAAAAGVLLRLYSKPVYLSQLENFTARFLKRLEDLVHDVDEGVKRTAIQVLRLLQGAGYLDEASQELLDEVDELLLDPAWDVRTREQAMLFFTDHVDGFNELTDGEDEESRQGEKEIDEGASSGGSPEKEKRKQTVPVVKTKQQLRRDSTGRQGGARRRGVIKRLVTVVQFLDYHLGERERWAPEHEELVAACVEAFERHPDGDFLYDWPTYFHLLGDESAASSSLRAGSTSTDMRLSDHEQSLLIRVLGASVKRATSFASPKQGNNSAASVRGRNFSGSAKPADMREARHRGQVLEAAVEAFTSGAVEDLPKVLSRFQTDPGKMAGLVGLPQYLQASTIANKRNRGHFEALLKLLRGMYLKATDGAVLQDIARSLSHLLQRDEEECGRLHNVGAVLHSIVAELLRRLGAVETARDGAGTKENKRRRRAGCEDTDFSTGLVLLQLGTLAKQIDITDYLGENEDGRLLEVTSCVQKVLLARLREVQNWTGSTEHLQLVVRVVREGLYLLYVVLLHSTRGLIFLAQAKRPANKKLEAMDNSHKHGPSHFGEIEKKGESDKDDVMLDLIESSDCDNIDNVGEKEANAILAQRNTLLGALSAVLSLNRPSCSNENGEGSEDKAELEGTDNNKSHNGCRSGNAFSAHTVRTRENESFRAIIDAIEALKKAAYVLVSDLRFLFRPLCSRYQILCRVAWTPEPDFLRLLQTFFQTEEARYEEAVATAKAQGSEEDLQAADEILRRDLLDPLIRSVLYTTESINRRQAAAIASHFVDSGRESTESVRFLMKQLKDLDVKLHLEVQMTTLRSCFHKWFQKPIEERALGGGEADVDYEVADAAAAAAMEKILRLGTRMAQTLGVGRVKDETPAADSFVRFIKSGIAFALDEAPKNFTFLDVLRCYMPKLPESRTREVVQLFRERTAKLPEPVKRQVEHERQLIAAEEEEVDLTQDGIAYLNFYHELYGHFGGAGALASGAPIRTSRTPSKDKDGNDHPHALSTSSKKRLGLPTSCVGQTKNGTNRMNHPISFPGDLKRRARVEKGCSASGAASIDEEESIRSFEDGKEVGLSSCHEESDGDGNRMLQSIEACSRMGGRRTTSLASRRRSSSLLPSVHEMQDAIDEADSSEEEEEKEGMVSWRESKATRGGEQSHRRRGTRKRGRISSQAEEEAEIEGRGDSRGIDSDSETSIFGELTLSKACGKGTGKTEKRKMDGGATGRKMSEN